ncbi:MAG: WD40 repeat domain-containing protein [Planctomycetota bacterium]|nr:WD40 repeat domain-containing protein [Planctomycetota bacterium]
MKPTSAAALAILILCPPPASPPTPPTPLTALAGAPTFSHPDDEEEIHRLIERLGSEEFDQREGATQRLIRLGEKARTTLESTLPGATDPEVIGRIRQVLHQIEIQSLNKIDLRLVIEVRVSGGAAHSVAVSLDGKLLASGGNKGDVILWDADTLEPVAVMHGHDHWVGTVAFDPTGRRLASAAGDVVIWDVKKASLIRRIRGSRIRKLAWSPDGRWIAYQAAASTLIVRGGEALDRKHVLKRNSAAIDAIAFSPDSKLVAAGNRNGEIFVHDVESGAEVSYEMVDPKTWIEDLAYLPGGTLAAVFRNGIVRCGEKQRQFSGKFSALAVSPDGKELAISGKDGKIHTWNLAADEVMILEAHPAWALSLAYTPDGKAIASAGHGGLAITDRNGVVRRANGHASKVQSLAFSPDGSCLAISGENGGVVFTDLGSGRQRGIEDSGILAAGHESSQFVLLGPESISFWDGREAKVLRSVESENRWKSVIGLTLSPDGERVIASNHSVEMIELGKGIRRAIGRGYESAMDFAWSPDGSTLAMACGWGRHGGMGGLVIVSDTGKLLHRELIDKTVTSVDFDTDGKTITWGDGQTLYRTDAKTFALESQRPLLTRWWRALNEKVAVGHKRSAVVFWHTPTMTVLREFPQPYIRDQALSRDGRHLALSDGRSVRVYAINLQARRDF